ncbi:hypothetical protein Lal_00018614 [Lupinus albus]|nr:hypothetical protein Lal_00018614 [Lupinus albus]
MCLGSDALAQARFLSLRRKSHSLDMLPLAQATHSSLGRDSQNFQFQNTDPLAWARSSRSSENLAVCPIPQDCYLISRRINLGCYKVTMVKGSDG